MYTPDKQAPPPVQTPVYSGIKRGLAVASLYCTTPDILQTCISTVREIEASALMEKSVAKQNALEAAQCKVDAAEQVVAVTLAAADHAMAAKVAALGQAMTAKAAAADEMMKIAKAYDTSIDESRERLNVFSHNLNEAFLFGGTEIADSALLSELTPPEVLR